jgi:hypothetical protein
MEAAVRAARKGEAKDEVGTPCGWPCGMRQAIEHESVEELREWREQAVSAAR